jgi:hypothetical protein
VLRLHHDQVRRKAAIDRFRQAQDVMRAGPGDRKLVEFRAIYCRYSFPTFKLLKLNDSWIANPPG